MVRAWYMADVEGKDQREPLYLDPHEPLEITQLEDIGVIYWKIDADNYEVEGKLEKISTERNYNYKDIIEIDENLPEYEKKLSMFFEEHLHLDEEIRFIMSGSGYFDIRYKDERWIRIEMTKGDLIALPAGSYHRFTLDTKNYVKAMRLFTGEPVWTPYNRPSADEFPVRKEYLASLQT